MFKSPITRPLRWALPLAVVGIVVSLAIGFSPVHSQGFYCGAAFAPFSGRSGGWFAYAPNTRAVLPNCGPGLATRYWVAQGVGALFVLPLVVFAIRGFIWGADAIWLTLVSGNDDHAAHG